MCCKNNFCISNQSEANLCDPHSGVITGTYPTFEACQLSSCEQGSGGSVSGGGESSVPANPLNSPACQQCLQQQCANSSASAKSSSSSKSGSQGSKASSSVPGFVACCHGYSGKVVIAGRYATINASRYAPPVSGFTYDLKGTYDDVKQCSNSQTFLMRQWRTEPSDDQVKQFVRHCVDYYEDRQQSTAGAQTPGQYNGYCCLPSTGCVEQNADQCTAAGHLSFPHTSVGFADCQGFLGAGRCP